MIVARRYLVRGRVQGVGFRYFVLQAALAEGLHGWVRNAPGGTVEVDAEGDLEALLRFERHLRLGPPASRVDDVTTDERPPSGVAGGFVVRQ